MPTGLDQSTEHVGSFSPYCSLIKLKGSNGIKNMTTRSKEANKTYFRKWYNANKAIQFTRIKDRQRRIRDQVAAYKATLKCSACDESHPACLDFHHIDGTKEINVSGAYTKGWSFDRIMKEISKCKVLCANCHRKIHYVERGITS